MAESTAAEMGRMAAAFGLVAAAAGAAGVVTRWTGRAGRWRVWRSSWSGWNVFLVGVGFLLLPSLIASFALGPPPQPDAAEDIEWSFRLMTVVPLFAAPLFAAGFFAWARVVEPGEWSWSAFGRQISLGVVGWFVIAPVTFAVHFAVKWVYEQSSGVPDEHPLTKLDPGRDIGRSLIFLAAVCVATPLLEELAFRRAVIPWLIRRPEPSLPRRFRVWAVMAVAGLAADVRSEGRVGPVAFFCLLAVLLAVGLRIGIGVRRFGVRIPERTVTAVFVTATLFAVVHSGVWPSPVPLFVLGLGLGWLVARTRSVVPAVVCHGLFNAVSTVFLLLSGPSG